VNASTPPFPHAQTTRIDDMLARTLSIAPLFAAGVVAWGNLGHETVGYVAQAVRTFPFVGVLY
jgi:hypothetical protein